jgi:hypothetical protein
MVMIQSETIRLMALSDREVLASLVNERALRLVLYSNIKVLSSGVSS